MPRSDRTGGSQVRAPVTRDQADAYRFGVRRLEAALVRADPVPMHEQIRSQRRAAIAGALIGMLAVGGVAIWSLIDPEPAWQRQAVVAGERSGALYVVAHEPDRLVPVANVAAARLVLAALQGGGSVSADPGTAEPVVVPDEALAGAPRTPSAAVEGAWAVDPGAPGIVPRWAVCDSSSRAEDGRAEPAGTTVVAAAAPTAPMAPGDAVLVSVPGGFDWLVTDGRRHRVDLDDAAVTNALGLTGAVPRLASPGLISALPVGVPLVTPDVPGAGTPAPAGLPGEVGDVLLASAAGAAPRHYVVLPDGVQVVPASLAETLRVAGAAERSVDLTDVAAVPVVETLDGDGWPAAAPRLVGPAAAPVLCWTWSGEPGADAGGGVFAGADVPAAEGGVTVELAQADGPGGAVDAIAMGPGGGGPVLAAGPGAPAGSGTLYLISATGVAYRVADEESGRALGVGSAQPAPEAVVGGLLPAGPTLDVAAARRTVDVLLPQG